MDKKNIFIPKELKIGFEKEFDSYNGKDSYIIYKDENGAFKNENLWTKWRNKEFEILNISNEPTKGFIIGKDGEGYILDIRHKRAYFRVQDPRGFEFKITVPNLSFILKNCSISKGGIINEELIYSWSDRELILLPINAPKYKDILEFSKDKLKGKKLE